MGGMAGDERSVVVIEDDAHIADLLDLYLREAGFRVLQAATGERVLGLELGADDYVVKPFSPREVVARVNAILRRGQPVAVADDVLRIGDDFEVDTIRREVRRRGEPVA